MADSPSSCQGTVHINVGLLQYMTVLIHSQALYSTVYWACTFHIIEIIYSTVRSNAMKMHAPATVAIL